jgi:hypothetical protein
MTGAMNTRIAIVVSLANYFLFFTGHLIALAQSRNVQVRQAAKRSSLRPPPIEPGGAQGTIGHRACAICGAREEDGTDIRVCTCAKCGGSPRTLCLAHARAH